MKPVMTMAIHVVVFWATLPCIQAGGHPIFGGTGLAAQKMELMSPKVCVHLLHLHSYTILKGKTCSSLYFTITVFKLDILHVGTVKHTGMVEP
jgi:hypothetical protein